MAGMFYSLQEVAEKLSKTEDEVKELVSGGRLREFRDGPNLLFKVDEVESLMSDTGITVSQQDSVEPEPEPEVEVAPELVPKLELEPDKVEPDEVKPEVEVRSELESELLADDDEIFLAPDLGEEPDLAAEVDLEDEVKIEDEAEADAELSGADTVVEEKGVNVLGESDQGYELANDSLSETQAVVDQKSLEAIDSDVNLDTFGSGSGLLDLSLQADDTSLGGILDEIYTSDGDEGQAAAGSDSAMGIAAEADQMVSDVAEPALQRAAMSQVYEPQADTMSNAFGAMLFLPLLAVVYAMIVVIAGSLGIMPVILQGVQGIIWYILIGLAVASVLIVGIAFMVGSGDGKSAKKPKAKKPKKVKEPKAKKEKKPKKPKKSKK